MSDRTSAVQMLRGSKLHELQRAIAFYQMSTCLTSEGHSEPLRKQEPSEVSTPWTPARSYLPDCRKLAGCIVAATLATSQAAGSEDLPKLMDTGVAAKCSTESARGRVRQQEVVATFYKPVPFSWDEDDYDVIEAVERYCESAYANR